MVHQIGYCYAWCGPSTSLTAGNTLKLLDADYNLHSEAIMEVNLALGFFLSSQIGTLEATISTPLWNMDELTIKYQLHTTALAVPFVTQV